MSNNLSTLTETDRLKIFVCTSFDDQIDDNCNYEPKPVLDLPKPSFRLVDNDHYKKRNFTVRKFKKKDGYYHYEEPTQEDLLTRVEYDMDLEDINWLESFNDTVASKKKFLVSENDFEKVMDRLEKVSYFESQRSGKGFVANVDDDAVCAICQDGNCADTNVILFCDLCDLAVHQECYGIPYVPEGQWLCRRCLQSPLRNVSCVLCPNMGGAFKQTEDGRWAHVICALWIPEVCFANTVFLEPIDGIDKIPQARWRLNCYICKQKRIGACIQCHKPNCYQPFHVTCGQQAGLHMKIGACTYNSADGEFYDVKKEAFCDIHTPIGSRNNGGGMYSGDETDEDQTSDAYRRKDEVRKKKIKKARRQLAEQRQECSTHETACIKVDDAKLEEISKLLGTKGKRYTGNSKELNELRLDYIKKIHNYWQLKRESRSGVPLLRRLQLSYFNSASKQNDDPRLDQNKYEDLRYNLERCRMLLGEVKKREIVKRRLFLLQTKILTKKLELIDKEDPPTEE